MNIVLDEKINAMEFLMKDLMNSNVYADIIHNVAEIKKNTNKWPTIILAGVGKNWYICEKVEKTFISMGIKTIALDCTHALHGDMGVLMDPDEDKLMFFISKSGTTDELIKLAKTVDYLVKADVIKNIARIAFYLNPKGKAFDFLYDSVLHPIWDKYDKEQYLYEFDSRNLVPSLSINTMQMVLDSIGVAIFEKDEKLMENYKYNHLAGNNGKLLGGDKILGKI